LNESSFKDHEQQPDGLDAGWQRGDSREHSAKSMAQRVEKTSWQLAAGNWQQTEKDGRAGGRPKIELAEGRWQRAKSYANGAER